MAQIAEELFVLLKNGNRRALSQAVTLIGANSREKQQSALQLMNLVYRHNMSCTTTPTLRIGVSGSPGAGKSSFIDAAAYHVLKNFASTKVAILTVDPSSPTSGGSLLADSLRMNRLSEISFAERVFIRSTPSAGHLGGVHFATPYMIQLCEAAGFENIFVETVGVGQSEVEVCDIVDLFSVILPPAAGDDIQAMKKGIIELADICAVTKCDGVFADAAFRTYRDYLSAIKLFSPKKNSWKTRVCRVSAKENTGVSEWWNMVQEFKSIMVANGYFSKRRKEQFVALYRSELGRRLSNILQEDSTLEQKATELEHAVADGSLWPSSAAAQFINFVVSRK